MNSATSHSRKQEHSCCIKSFPIVTRRLRCWSPPTWPLPNGPGSLAIASLTAALLDRLTHRCYIYEFDWESIRLAESLKRQKKIRRERSAKSRPK